MTVTSAHVEALVMEMQSDFLDTPGLQLTLSRAQGRFGVDESTCKGVLDALVDARVLERTTDGAYTRRFPRITFRTLARARRPRSTRRSAAAAVAWC